MKIFNLIITTKKAQDDFLLACMDRLDKLNKLMGHATINPVIHSLKELRKNTWDVERVDQAIKWLEDNFEIKK